MKDLIKLTCIKQTTFANKYGLNTNSINHWTTNTEIGTIESKLKILSGIKKHIEELTNLYNEEMKEIKELFDLSTNLK